MKSDRIFPFGIFPEPFDKTQCSVLSEDDGVGEEVLGSLKPCVLIGFENMRIRTVKFPILFVQINRWWHSQEMPFIIFSQVYITKFHTSFIKWVYQVPNHLLRRMMLLIFVTRNEVLKCFYVRLIKYLNYRLILKNITLFQNYLLRNVQKVLCLRIILQPSGFAWPLFILLFWYQLLLCFEILYRVIFIVFFLQVSKLRVKDNFFVWFVHLKYLKLSSWYFNCFFFAIILISDQFKGGNLCRDLLFLSFLSFTKSHILFLCLLSL